MLSDINTCSPDTPTLKRACADQALQKIKEQAVRIGAPRGFHSACNIQQQQQNLNQHLSREHSEDLTTTEPYEDTHTTLKHAVSSRPEVLEQGFACLQQYTERNTTFTIQKAFALQVFAGSVLRGSGILESCELAAACTPFSACTVRRWASTVFVDYFSIQSNIDDITDKGLEAEITSSKGKHPKWVSHIADENFQKEVREYVRETGYSKGKPNLTLQTFIAWVEEKKGVTVCSSTASVWLHSMGFSYKQFSKGLYFDGHEREDVVKDRTAYLATLESYRHRMCISHSPVPNPLCYHVIRIFHDESTFYANADQSYYWTDGSKQALKQKSLGQAIMVSDFIDEVNGFLKHNDEEACLLLEHQSDGYFTNDMLVTQVVKAVGIFERKYPGAQGLFIFDNAPSHMKRPEDALNPDRMNVKDGGKQPFMRDTEWNGTAQRMVTDGGIQKGMKTILEEKGVETKGLNADGLRKFLWQYEVVLWYTCMFLQFCDMIY